MEEVSFGPDLMIPAPRTAEAVPVVPRQTRTNLNGIGLDDAAAMTPDLAGLAPAADLDLTRLPKPVLMALEVGFAAAAGLFAGWAVNLHPMRLVLIVAMTLVVHYYSGVDAVRPGMPKITRLVRETAVPFSMVAVGVAFLHVDQEVLRDAGVVIFSVTAAAAVGAMARQRAVGPVRLVVMGSSPMIAQLATRWAGDRKARVVGGIAIGSDPSIPPGSEGVLSAPVVRDSDDVADWVSQVRADVVVVVPGPGVTSKRVQRLGWQLEGGPAAISLLSPLEHVAPHRVDAAQFAGTTLIHVASSRPSVLIRTLKCLTDRVLGGLILLLVTPLLLLLVALVRLDSRGPGIFKQTRVGKDGREFTMYKMRTMTRDAEQLRDALRDQDEGNGVLFKIKHDPRITRVGRVLRKTSLDELPQLINVVRGHMSLVGPRPALPDEVATYTAHERRRLAIRPGLTGLWQVSGRSNLSWDRSIELDLRYTDNWRLIDDLGIGVRTVGAVARPHGAY